MSTGRPSCPQCFTGICTRHKSQDHGKSTQHLHSNKISTLQSIYNETIGNQLAKLNKALDVEATEKKNQDHRSALDEARERTLKKQSKKSKRPSTSAPHHGSGLNPQALAATYAEDVGSSSSSDAGESSRRKKKRKRKKHSGSSDDSSSSSDEDPKKRHRKKKKSSSKSKKSKKAKKSRRK